MVDVMPLILVGNTLGERHRSLNVSVNNAIQKNIPIDSILELPEENSIDRVFKIKLASKYKHVDFVIKNLMHKDILYVSLALKNTWLLDPEYCHIINPNYLEKHLYPEMITTAVNKMKNFIELKLKNPERCQIFYEYYKSNFNVAIKFLWHCFKEFIIEEVLKIIHDLTPKHLRILCEACPQVARIYFEGLQDNTTALRRFLNDQNKYFNSISNVLKVDGDLYLDIIEKYFDKSSLDPLSSSLTRYIMISYKHRYLAKPELYAAWLLHVKTLTRFLNNEELKDILIKLARADYLGRTFTYVNAEPFLKCLSVEERASMKKQIFVDKTIGDKIEAWPYPAPEPLQLDNELDREPFEDIEHNPWEYEDLDTLEDCIGLPRRKISKRKFLRAQDRSYITMQSTTYKSGLDQLFDRYRFANFDKTFFELRKSLLTEGTIDGRRNMMLVLVSKTGGNEEKLEKLLNFLSERHSNEPVHLRAAVARSMVNRAFVWRLPSVTWELLLKWTNNSVSEILHSKILRHLLASTEIPSTDLAAYLLDFDDLTDYALSPAERACIAERLPALLVSAESPLLLLDTLKAYNVRVNTVPGAEDLLVSAARKDEDILRRLFDSKVARKHLLKEAFKITQTDAAYMNALKHDQSVLQNGESFAALVAKEKPNHDRFLRTLILYFSEPHGLAAQHRIALEKGVKVNDECKQSFARPLAYLFNLGDESFANHVEKIDVKALEASQRKFEVALRANAFVVRPVIDIDVANWKIFGAKFICNKVLLCSDRAVDANIQKCLSWKRTMRAALRLITRSKSATNAFATVLKIRPTVALKYALADKRNIDLQLWNQVKPVISNLDLSKKNLQYLKRSLGDLYLECNIEGDYWATVYTPFYRVSELAAMPMLCKIENLLTEVDDNSLKLIISTFLNERLTKDGIKTNDSNVLCLYFRVIAKYLIASENIHIQEVKRKTICDPFFDKIEILWQLPGMESKIIQCLDDFLLALKFSKVFFSKKYVSCIPMFESILERLRLILPRERYFGKYVCIHLTMLYYRSIIQALKQKPEIFENLTLKRKEGVQLVGFIFGKYIGIEIQDLLQKYFKSIIDIYQRGLIKFLRDYFQYNDSRSKLVTSVTRGLLEGGIDSQLLAVHIFEKEQTGNDQEREEILKLLKEVNNEEIKLFLYANMYPY